ncbi:MAG TPA: aspartate aminotransferase [Rhodocyclaceae bacterium]|nr:aspartate aminotransferase [Rhodocyclaceae bacterium]
MSIGPDFDAPAERHGGDSLKWNRYGGRDVLPMWVADMDFRAPEAVLDALHRRVEHGVFGYARPWASLVEAVVEALARDHRWRIEPDWLIWLPGLVTGLNVACRAVGEPGDAVLTCTPIYPPFLSAPRHAARVLATAPLECREGRWEPDFERIEGALTPRTRLLLLCNPHNPTGRVLDVGELRRIAGLAERHDLVVCSDEIHCGLVLEPGCEHIPLASLDPAIARRTITLMAASKTYNLPGLGCAFAIVPDPELRRSFRAAMAGIVPDPGIMGWVATEAACRHGERWRSRLIEYLRGNRDRAMAAIATMPGLEACAPQATFLAWIDARATELADPAAFFESAGVGLSDGRDFAAPGYVRLNFGCSRALLEEALRRMRVALDRAP